MQPDSSASSSSRPPSVELNIGYASALSFMMFLLILAITAVQFKLGSREIRY